MAGDWNDDDERVDYRRPPMRTRFRQGQSGNPKGRPKASPPSFSEQLLLKTILKEAKKPIAVREGDKVKRIPTSEALITAIVHKALKGDTRAQALALGVFQAADEAEAHDIAERNEIWERYQSRTRAELAEAQKRGLPPPVLLPHPDDIVIDRRTCPAAAASRGLGLPADRSERLTTSTFSSKNLSTDDEHPR